MSLIDVPDIERTVCCSDVSGSVEDRDREMGV